MKLRSLISSILAAAVVITDSAVISVPIVSAEMTNTDTVYREDFEGFANTNYSPTLKTLKEYGWFAADHNTLYISITAANKFTTALLTACIKLFII